MNEFQSIMRLMNNGVHNDSTLKESIPAILKFTLRYGNEKANEALEWVPKEEALRSKNGHRGIDDVVNACNDILKSIELQQEKVR